MTDVVALFPFDKTNIALKLDLAAFKTFNILALPNVRCIPQEVNEVKSSKHNML